MGRGSMPTPGAVSAVADAAAAAWRRMTSLMWAPPHRSFVIWLRWGFLSLLSGGGSYGLQYAFDGDKHELRGLGPASVLRGPEVGLVGLGLFCLLLFALTLLYVSHVSRLVMIDGIAGGYPRLLDPARQALGPALQYFLFDVALFAGALFLLLPLAAFWIWAGVSVSSEQIEGSVVFVPLILLSILWTGTVLIAGLLLNWFVRVLVLPVFWLGRTGFLEAVGRAARLVAAHPLATILFLCASIAFRLAAAAIGFLAACATCLVWVPPTAAVASLLVLAAAAPPMLLIAVPIAVLYGLLLAWLFATLLSPLAVFGRGWSMAFVGVLDRSIIPWRDQPAVS